jgi:hypothetical protein
MNGRNMMTRQGSQSSTQALTLKGQLQNNKMTKGDIVTTFFMNIPEDRNKPSAIGEIISAPSGDILVLVLFVPDRLTTKEDIYPSEGVKTV